jgi:hypothetical protein
MGGRRLQFIISVPKGMRVADINHIDHIQVDVIEDRKRIDRLTYAQAKEKYGH